MDKYERRRLNLIRIRDDFCGGVAATLAARIDRPASYVTRMLYPPGKAGRKRIAEDMVDVIEGAFDLPRGWMDGLAPTSSTITAAVKKQGHSDTVSPGPKITGEIPVISWVQAGDFCEAVDTFQPGDADDWLPFAGKHSKKSYALRVRGSSMEPRFREGEVIIVDPEVSPDSGRFVIAKKTGAEEATFKQLMIEGGEPYLRALNPNWPEPIIRVTEEWHICGVVIAKMELF